MRLCFGRSRLSSGEAANFPEPCSLKFLSLDEGLKRNDELVASEHGGASATAAELVGAELGHKLVGLSPLNLEDLFGDGAFDDGEGESLDWGGNVGQTVKPGELWRLGTHLRGDTPGKGLCAW
jgi:hypothetical protein